MRLLVLKTASLYWPCLSNCGRLKNGMKTADWARAQFGWIWDAQKNHFLFTTHLKARWCLKAHFTALSMAYLLNKANKCSHTCFSIENVIFSHPISTVSQPNNAPSESPVFMPFFRWPQFDNQGQ